MRLFVDLRPLRDCAPFRRLWAGHALSALGTQMTFFAVSLQVYTITRSSAAVGAVGLAAAAPTILIAPVGGVVADMFDRRRLVLVTSTCLAALSTALALQAFAGSRNIWLIYSLVAAQSVIGAVNGPVRRTFLPRLLTPASVPSGAALTMLAMHASLIAGPVVAGTVAGLWGVKICYLVDAISFTAALYGVARLPAMPPDQSIRREGLRAAADGVRFIRGKPVILGVLAAEISASVLGMPMALFPAMNAEHFGGAAQTLGLLVAAPGAGGLIGALLSGTVANVRRQGRAMLVAGAAWGACVAGFGLARSLWLALILLCLAGAADVISVVFRTTIVQLTTPDGYRGRVSAVEYIVGVGSPQLGNFRAGMVGSLTSPAASAVTGGLGAVLGVALVARLVPALIRYRSESHGNDYRVKSARM
jgi:MFS family permease